MTYPPPNPYDPGAQPPGHGQTPQHYTTDADPYSRPDPYGPGPGYGNPPLNVQPGSAPPGTPYSPAPPPAYPGQQPPPGYQPAPPGLPGGAFQPGQAAPPPPRSGNNLPLILTLVVVVIAVAAGGIILAMNLGGDGEPSAEKTTSAAEETTEPAEETTEPTPSEEETTGTEATYRVPAEGECIENVTTGFYVVDCSAATAYWYVVHIVQAPADPDPNDPNHAVAANDACAGYEWSQYYYTDTAIAAGRDWDPDIDSITAIYCVREV
ncbi:hypothetical protein AB0B28_00825 [Glycomyces sp. NPDC046736]|uniref:hypothetical protein n=1 Tax=Glycomyces sp. NPDC046736 TaxID=3155615 RepID=UPI0033F1DEA0